MRSRAASASRWRGPSARLIVIVGDGSYLMLNSEIATSRDARQEARSSSCSTTAATAASTGCSRRCGGAPFNNLFADCVQGPDGAPPIDFAAHARGTGRARENVERRSAELEAALSGRARAESHVRDRDRDRSRTGRQTRGPWWDVAVPEVSGGECARTRAFESTETATRLDGHRHSAFRNDDNKFTRREPAVTRSH